MCDLSLKLPRVGWGTLKALMADRLMPTAYDTHSANQPRQLVFSLKRDLSTSTL